MGFVANEIPESLTEYNAYKGYTAATAFATHVRAYNRWWAENVPVHRRARAGHQEEHLLPLVADALQLPRRRHPRAGLPVPDVGRGRAGLQQRDRADPADAHRRPQVPAQRRLLLRRLAVASARRPRAAGSWTTRATRRTGPTATPSTSPRRPGAATRSTAGSRRSPATSPSTPRATSRASCPSTTTTTTASSSTTGARSPATTPTRCPSTGAPATWTAPSRRTSTAARSPRPRRTRRSATPPRPPRCSAIADRIQQRDRQHAVGLRRDKLLEHRHVATNTLVPVEGDQQLLPVLGRRRCPTPTTYKQALRLFADPAEYPVFPFYTANQKDKAAAAAAGSPGSNNFSTINSTVQFRLYSSVLRNYPNQWMSTEDYKKLLYWNAWAQYIGGNTQWPDANEFWADWNAAPRTSTTGPGSTTTSSAAATGPSSRTWRGCGRATTTRSSCQPDQHRLAELRGQQPPLPQRRPQRSSGTTRPTASSSTPGVPQGYSIFVNGTRAATVDKLVRSSGTRPPARSPSPDRRHGHLQQRGLRPAGAEPGRADQTPRMVDMFAKAGVDLTANLTNLAAGRDRHRVLHRLAAARTGAAVDGYPTNEPFWGAGGSANAQDWYEVNFGSRRSRSTRCGCTSRTADPASATYRAPSSYTDPVLQRQRLGQRAAAR